MSTQNEYLKKSIARLEANSGPDSPLAQQLKLQLASNERRDRRQQETPEETLWRWQMGFHPK